MELVQMLALLQKPIVYSFQPEDPNTQSDVIADVINAVRLFGHAQIIFNSLPIESYVEQWRAQLQKIIQGMAIEGENFVVSEPIELATNTARLDITLEK